MKIDMSMTIDVEKYRPFLNRIFSEEKLTGFLCVMILGFPILELICVPLYLPFFLQEFFLEFCGFYLLVFCLFKALISKEHRLCLSDLLLIASVLFAVLSIVTSLNIDQSLHGQPNYSETPLQTLGYFMAFFACSQVEKSINKKKLLYAFSGMFLLEMIVGTLQKLGFWKWEDIWEKCTASYGLTENSNFYAALCVLAVALFMCIYVLDNFCKRTKRHSVCTYILSVWAFSCALFSVARLAWIGMAGAVGLMFCLHILLKKKTGLRAVNLKKACILLVCFLIVFLLFSFFDPVLSEQHRKLWNDILTFIGFAQGESDSTALNKLGSKRGYIWRVCIKAWLQRPLLGIGFDNLRYAFSMFNDPQMGGFTQGKAHNEYLHYLTTQGLFSCLNYLFLCGYVMKKGVEGVVGKFKTGLRTGEHETWIIQFALVVMVFGYFCQAFFSSSVTNIAVYKWIIMGLLMTRSEQKNLLRTS